jgi:putative addiction module component (TIGR02574 family)
MGKRELLEAAIKLDPAERLQLVDEVLHGLDQPDAAVDEAWIEEALQRLAAHRAGDVQGIPAEDVVGRF